MREGLFPSLSLSSSLLISLPLYCSAPLSPPHSLLSLLLSDRIFALIGGLCHLALPELRPADLA